MKLVQIYKKFTRKNVMLLIKTVIEIELRTIFQINDIFPTKLIQ